MRHPSDDVHRRRTSRMRHTRQARQARQTRQTGRIRSTRRTRTVVAAVLAAACAAALGGAPGGIPGGATPAWADEVPHAQLRPLGAAEAWEHTTGDGVTVAVLDSGVDDEHPALAGRVAPGRDFVNGSTDGRTDPVGHGTTVASLVAGAGEPALGLAPQARILPVRVLDEDNRYEDAATVADGVRWAVDQGADVVNLSLGGHEASAALSAALSYAMAHDVVVVACTGNRPPDRTGDTLDIWYPAREPGVVAVAGLTYEDHGLVGWSPALTGAETVLSAPAVVRGAAVGGGTRQVRGTSFSSALVAGAAALVRARFPEMPAGAVVHRLVTTADDLGPAGRDTVHGYGAVDPLAALTTPVAPVRHNPLDTKVREGAAAVGTAPDQPDTPHPPGDPAGRPAEDGVGDGAHGPPRTLESETGGEDRRGDRRGPAHVGQDAADTAPAAAPGPPGTPALVWLLAAAALCAAVAVAVVAELHYRARRRPSPHPR